MGTDESMWYQASSRPLLQAIAAPWLGPPMYPKMKRAWYKMCKPKASMFRLLAIFRGAPSDKKFQPGSRVRLFTASLNHRLRMRKLSEIWAPVRSTLVTERIGLLGKAEFLRYKLAQGDLCVPWPKKTCGCGGETTMWLPTIRAVNSF